MSNTITVGQHVRVSGNQLAWKVLEVDQANGKALVESGNAGQKRWIEISKLSDWSSSRLRG